MQNKEIPEWAKCPITKKRMLDPVIAADGRTYEGAAIEQLIAQNPRGPVLAPGSSSALKHSFLIDDQEKMDEIIAWVKTQPEEYQAQYERDRAAQLKLRKNDDVEERAGTTFFNQLPRDLIYLIIGRHLNSLTLSECKNLAQARIPPVSKYFQVAIRAANQNVRKFLDHVRRGDSTKANQMLAEDPALLTLKDVKISKLFLHLLRGEFEEVQKMRKEDPDLLPDEEFQISQFLVHVSTGNLDEVKKILRSKEGPELLFKKGRLVDFGLRRFTEASKEGEEKGIYACQYADATPDESMKRLLESCCPQERKVELKRQLEESRSKEGNKHYKALDELRHSIETNRDKLGIFIEFMKPLYTNEQYEKVADKVKALWRNVVEAQLKLATCVIHLMTEKGEKVGWHDASETGPRESKTRDPANIKWMYNQLGKYCDASGVLRGRVVVCGLSQACMGGDMFCRAEADHQKLSQLSAPTRAAVPKDSSDDSPSAGSIR